MLELLLVMTLLGIFLGVAYESVIVGLRTVNAADERETVRQQLAAASDRLTRELDLASAVTTAQDQDVLFNADLDGDGTAETNIEYRLQNATLQRLYGGTTLTLAAGVTAFDLDYTDLNGTSLSAPVTGALLHNIRVAQITVTATKDNETLALASAAYLRNNQ